MGWSHGNQFLCVAFLNSMAAAINGTTLHSGADVPMARDDGPCRSSVDIDNLFVKNTKSQMGLGG